MVEVTTLSTPSFKVLVMAIFTSSAETFKLTSLVKVATLALVAFIFSSVADTEALISESVSSNLLTFSVRALKFSSLEIS